MSTSGKDILERAMDIVGYRFSDESLLLTAITHPSAHEGNQSVCDYERLEFLGDSVVGFIVSEELYRRFPDYDEGDLTRLKVSIISGENLSEVAWQLGLKDVIILGLSEKGTGSRGLHSALENVYEALTAALYLDGGMQAAKTWVLRTLGSLMTSDHPYVYENPKSALQEKVQADCHLTPHYVLVGVEGPAHAPIYTADCCIGERHVGRGSGASKKEAESAAALEALETLGYSDRAAHPTPEE